MKNSVTAPYRAFQICRLQRAPVRALSASACSRDASSEAESSSTASSAHYPSQQTESVEESWKRNMSEVRDWRRRHASNIANMPLYLPQTQRAPIQRTPFEATLSTLLASGAALGHASSLLSVPYTPYVYGNRSGLSIIDLEQTLPLLRRAAALVRDVVKADGVVLLVGTRPAHKKSLFRAKERLEDNGYAVTEWMPGTLTNSETYFGMQPMLEKSYLPDLVIFLNPSENLGAIRECTTRNVPTVGIVDTDCDPRIVTYPIPANMESVRTAELIIGTLSIAGQEGRRMRIRESERREKRKERDSAYKRSNNSRPRK